VTVKSPVAQHVLKWIFGAPGCPFLDA